MSKRISIIFVSFTLMLMGCYKRYQLPRIEPTDEYVSRQIEVFTKSGQSYTLSTYKITETKIIGRDKEDKQHQFLIENIDRVIVINRHTSGEYTFAFLAVVVGSLVIITLNALNTP